MKLKYIYSQEPVIYSYLHAQGSYSFKSLVIDAVGVKRGMLVTPTPSMTGFKRPNLLHSPCAYIHVCILSYIQQPLRGVGYRIFAVQYT